MEIPNMKMPNLNLNFNTSPKFELSDFKNLPPPTTQDLESLKNMLSQISTLSESINKMQHPTIQRTNPIPNPIPNIKPNTKPNSSGFKKN